MNAARMLRLAPMLVSLVALAACGDDTAGSGGGGSGEGGAGGADQTGVTTSTGPSSIASTTSSATSTSATSTSATSTGSTGGGGSSAEFIPTPETIQFGAIAPLPDGEQILFNDWNASPNTVATMTPEGDAATTIFEAFRVWSMGVSHDGNTVAFSSGDPDQLEHYGIEIGDAIQHTFLYDAATEVASALTWGNINDECHAFSADDATLYLCRRYDFRIEDDFVVNGGYRIGRVDVASGDFEFLVPEDADVMTLSPQPDATETTALVQWIDLPSARSIRSLDLSSGETQVVVDDAGFPVLSPDGSRFLYVDYTDQGTLWAADIAGGNEVLVADAQASGARWSPDGTRVVYMLWDDAVVCSHVETVAADGSDAASPTRIRDCGASGEFITDVAWITR